MLVNCKKACQACGSILNFYDILQISCAKHWPCKKFPHQIFVLAGIKNTYKVCWWKCNKKQGPCDWCGTGMCCKKGETGNGCDGTFGGESDHRCSMPSPSML